MLTRIGFDLAATFPKFINIRRGAYITALISVACNPWKLVNTATTFLAVLSSYSVFLGPMTGLMISSYFVVNRQRIKVDDLFVGSSQSIYWYNFGVNWRAVVAVCSLISFSSFRFFQCLLIPSMMTNYWQPLSVDLWYRPFTTWVCRLCKFQHQCTRRSYAPILYLLPDRPCHQRLGLLCSTLPLPRFCSEQLRPKLRTAKSSHG